MTSEVLTEVDRLVGEGRLVEAVDALATANREAPGAGLDIRLLDLRRKAAQVVHGGPGRAPWPPAYDDPFPGVAGRLPEISAAELGPAVIGGAIAHHGGVIVRGVLDEGQVAHTIAAIDRAQSVRDLGPADPSWYRPFPVPPAARSVRGMVVEQGGTWLADSPAATALVLHQLATAGAIDAIARHFGERPFISLQKSTMRRSRPINKLTAWHQDGSFLGADVRTVNVWLALSRCGTDHPAPGLEIVPKRVAAILPTDGRLGQSSISPATVAEAAAPVPVIRPEFAPGDALMFDERFVHRTYLDANMTQDRYAVECWFFAPSHDADRYVSFLA
jgi:hypothetical protein